MPTPEVDIRVPLGRPLPELAEFAARCESAGLHGVGVPDHHHIGRDTYLALGAMAGHTRALRLYPATSNVVTRHPLVTAALANSLDELAPGRVMLTVAPGFLSVEKAGQPPGGLPRVREVVTTLRALLGQGHARLDGQDLELYHRPVQPRVLLLASGPRLLELAGEVADGVMMLVGLHPDSVEAARAHVRRGAERAGRDAAALHEVLIVPFALGDEATVRTWAQGWFREGQPWLRYPSRSNLRWLRRAGIDIDDDYRPGDVDDHLAGQICDAFGLFGSAQQCAARLIRARTETALRHIFLFPAHTWNSAYELPHAEVEAFASTIGPRLQEETP